MMNEDVELSIELRNVLTPEQAWEYKTVPKYISDGKKVFVTDRVDDVSIILAELELVLGESIDIEVTSSDEVNLYLHKFYALAQTSNDNQIPQGRDFVDTLINDAHKLSCSDIHIECYENLNRIRFRLDGDLVERYNVTQTDYPALINKVKILANLDISEKRLPQDGRILYSNGVNLDIRVSTVPTMYGEKVVLRLLGKDASLLDIENIGLEGDSLRDYFSGINKYNGIVLISGPTGSGKTTTLYATLNYLNKESRNIITIEDPIEYTLDGINQVQLKESIGLSYSTALRTFLRQDPDVIMVGEIRDVETANMAIRAALTGHLVLSTIHTNSAWGIVTRLLEMGIPDYLIAGTLNSVVAQRLVRKLCPNCSVPVADLDDRVQDFVCEEDKLSASPRKAVGCEKCYYTGYKGRVAIYEVMAIDEELINSIKLKANDVSDYIAKNNISSLASSALKHYLNGLTSIEEVISFVV